MVGVSIRLEALLIVLSALAATLPAVPRGAAEAAEEDVTVVTITDKVLVEDCTPFGVNLTGRNLLKKPVELNFEGTSHRVCLNGEIFRDGYLCYTVGESACKYSHVDKFWPGGTVLILSGDARGQKRTIAGVELREAATWPWLVSKGQRTVAAFLVFDKPVEGLPEDKRTDLSAVHEARGNVNTAFAQDPLKNVGALVEKSYLDVGWCGRSRGFQPPGNCKKLTAVQGDTPPGSFGLSALLVDPGDVQAALRFPLFQAAQVDCDGVYRVSFWVKANGGAPRLTVGWDSPADIPSEEVPVTAEWQKHELKFDLRGRFAAAAARAKSGTTAQMIIQGGSVLLDDIAMGIEDDENPTPFRTEVVEVLKDANVGIIRLLQEGGDTMRNTLSPRLQQHSYDGSVWHVKGDPSKRSWFSGQRHFTLHELYALCEHLGCEPWYVLPGTLYPEEIDTYIEYVGAAADVGAGRLRAAQGHPKPWTETLRRMHVEFGNEIWNFMGEYKVSSYDGPDYWEGLISRGKNSPHYKDNITFVMGTADLNVVPSADRVMRRAPYIIHSLKQEELDLHKTPEELYRWVFGYALLQNVTGGTITDAARAVREAGKELAVYEVNYHAVSPDDTLEKRNEIVTSLAAGVNLMNAMLGQVKLHHVRAQCFFNFMGQYYQTRLWGGVISTRRGGRRYRPTWLGLTLANKVLGGDLVETVHTGTAPKFIAIGRPGRKWAKEAQQEFPCIFSYAFRTQDARGLLLVNLDLAAPQTVELEFPGDGAGPATTWLLSGPTFTANNELEHEAQVQIAEGKIVDFRSGHRLVLPACSAMAIRWPAKPIAD